MPDFTSNIQVAPQDQIGPAINDLAGNMMKMTQFKAAEQEKRDAKLAELASISLGDVFADDNADLQTSKEQYINEVVKESAKSRGRIPWQSQAELMAKKQALAQKAAVSTQHREEYADIMKKMATDPNIDPIETGAALEAWRKTPLSERGSAWSTVQPKISLQEIFKKGVNLNIEKDRYMKGNELRATEKFNSLPQMMAIVSENTLVQNKVVREMEKAGIPKPANGYKAEQIGSYLQKTYGPMFDRDYDGLVRVEKPTKSSGGGSEGSYETTPPAQTFGEGNTRQILSFVDESGKPKSSKLTITFGKDANYVNDAIVTMPGTTYINLSGYSGRPEQKASARTVKVKSVQSVPVVYSNKTKEWHLVTNEWLEKHPEEKANVKMKRYILGEEEIRKENTKTGVVETKAVELLFPANATNMSALKNGLAVGDRKTWRVDPDDFSAPTKPNTQQGATGKRSVKLSDLRAANPGVDDGTLMGSYGDIYNIIK